MRYCFIYLLFIIVACKSATMQENNEKSDQEAISFGNAGGITGGEDRFLLQENGQLCKLSGKDTIQLKTIPSEEATSYLEQLNKLHKQIPSFEKQGNMSYFIEHINKEKVIYSVTWGKPGDAPPEEVTDLYKKLQKLL